jgi:DNA-binding MarR family transcriptional regulator
MSIDPTELANFFDSETLGAPDRAIGFVLWRIMHRYQRAVDRTLAPLDLTHLQFTTLAMTGWLCRTGKAVTQSELAQRADIHAMQVSLMLRALEGKGLVTRLRSTTDTRAKRVEITSAGLEALRAAMPLVIVIQRQIFGASGEPGGALLAGLHVVETGSE